MIYSNEELTYIIELYNKCTTFEIISNKLKEKFNIYRTAKAISVKCNRLGLTRKNLNIKTHEKYLFELQSINDTIIPLEEYVTNNTKIRHKCLICDNEWFVVPYSLTSHKSGCPNCDDKNRYGRYTKLTKHQADNLGYNLFLYTIKLAFEDEVFYKYGITRYKSKIRFNGYGKYKVIEELSFKEYDAWTAIQLEKNLKSNYIPKYKFSGYTECYK